MKKILVTGSLGQIGSELVPYLRALYGKENVIATDLRKREGSPVASDGIFEELDVMSMEQFRALVDKYKVDTIIHLAALLSAKMEERPLFGWNLNMGGLFNCLETAKEFNLSLFVPSSIAAFGPTSPADNTPQDTLERPTTMYGITKVAGELLCDYYHEKYGVDTRGLRFPGLISYTALPGGGTTDYAVSIFYDAIEKGEYTSYIAKGTFMDMMYLPDALKAIVDLMEADYHNLRHRNSFNISAMSIDPEELAKAIAKVIPNFKIHYDVDPVRQRIADSWPNAIDSSVARAEWNFTFQYDLDKMTKDMIEKLRVKLNK